MKISVYSSVKHTCAHQITVLPMYLHRKTGYSHNADIYIYKHVRVGGAIFFFLPELTCWHFVFSALSQQHPWQQRNNGRAHACLVGHKQRLGPTRLAHNNYSNLTFAIQWQSILKESYTCERGWMPRFRPRIHRVQPAFSNLYSKTHIWAQGQWVPSGPPAESSQGKHVHHMLHRYAQPSTRLQIHQSTDSLQLAEAHCAIEWLAAVITFFQIAFVNLHSPLQPSESVQLHTHTCH